jgi:hypothetical protein
MDTRHILSTRWIRRFWSCDKGQEIVEFSLLLPVLLVLLFGVVEAGRALATEQRLSALSREAANIASRGATLDEALTLVMTNGSDVALEARGGAVVSRIVVVDSIPVVFAQETSAGYEQRSLLGLPDSVVTVLDGLQLDAGQTLFAVELYLDQPAFTPLPAFVEGWVGSLYERAIF